MLHRLFPVVFVVACSEPGPPVDHAARRAAFHAELELSLGAAWNAPMAEVVGGAKVSAGQEIYDKSCGNCHGTTLDGRGPRSGGVDPRPPALVGDQAAKLPPAALLAIVRDGSPGTGMAPWGRAFSEAQLRDVVAYILARRQGAATHK